MEDWAERVGWVVEGDEVTAAALVVVATVVGKEQCGARNQNSRCPVRSPRIHYQAHHRRTRRRESIHTLHKCCYTQAEGTAAVVASAAAAEAVEEAKAAQVAKVDQLVLGVARVEYR